jgi:hypothetical protein
VQAGRGEAVLVNTSLTSGKKLQVAAAGDLTVYLSPGDLLFEAPNSNAEPRQPPPHLPLLVLHLQHFPLRGFVLVADTCGARVRALHRTWMGWMGKQSEQHARAALTGSTGEGFTGEGSTSGQPIRLLKAPKHTWLRSCCCASACACRWRCSSSPASWPFTAPALWPLHGGAEQAEADSGPKVSNCLGFVLINVDVLK